MSRSLAGLLRRLTTHSCEGTFDPFPATNHGPEAVSAVRREDGVLTLPSWVIELRLRGEASR